MDNTSPAVLITGTPDGEELTLDTNFKGIQIFNLEGKIVGIINDENDVADYESGLKDGTLSITMDNADLIPAFVPMNLPNNGFFPPEGAKPVLPKRKIRRNDPCFCKSGKKFKKCCLRKVE